MISFGRQRKFYSESGFHDVYVRILVVSQIKNPFVFKFFKFAR